MSTINSLKWVALTAAINAMKSPNRFLQRLLWGNHLTLPVEDIELGTRIAGRDIAPFIRKNGEAVLVSGTSTKFATVAGPNIRIKQPHNPSNYFNRQPGTQILLADGQTQVSAVNEAIAADLAYMDSLITNATEYLCSRALQGSIQFAVEDQEVITITVPRSAGNSITLSVFWDTGGASARPLQNIHTVKEVMSEAEGLAPTDAICGAAAAHALLELHEAGHIKLLGLQPTQPSAGMIDWNTAFSDDGVIFLGTLAGVRFWQYSRTANLNGVATAMIRDKWVEFVSVGPASERVLYYAGIADVEAFEGGLLRSEKFSKSWVQKDPSVRMYLAHSRPLPWSRKPDSTVSMKVVSG